MKKSKPKTENRGVKKGTKRGKYNKQKKQISETVKKKTNERISPIDNNSIDTTNFNNEVEKESVEHNQTDIQITETKNEHINTDIQSDLQNNYESDYEEFLNSFKESETENKTESETTENENKTENKSFDFTNSNNFNTDLSNNKDINNLNKTNSQLINGFMLLALCDFVIPTGLLFIYKYIDSRSEKIKVKDIQLDSDQKEALMESANICAKYIFEKVNPFVAFFLCMGVCYGTNLQNVLSQIPKENVKEKIKKK